MQRSVKRMKRKKEVEINGVIYTPLEPCSFDEQHCFNCSEVNKVSDDEWYCGVDSSYHYPRNCPLVICDVDYW